MKEYTINSVELSELSFISQSLKARQEEVFYWEKRREGMIDTILKARSLSFETHNLDFSKLWTEGKVFFSKKPPVKVENDKPEVQAEPSEGTEARK